MPLFAPLLLDRRAWSLMLDFLDQRDSLSSTPLVFPPTSPPPSLLPPNDNTRSFGQHAAVDREERKNCWKCSIAAAESFGHSASLARRIRSAGRGGRSHWHSLPPSARTLTSHQANKPPLVHLLHHHSRLLLRYLLACCAPTASTTTLRAAGAARKHTFAPFTTARKAQRCFAHARHRSSLAFL